MTEAKLKAYIVTYTFESKADEDDMHSVVIIAYSKDEAGDIFIKWLNAKHMYEVVRGVVVQQTRKTRRNAHMFTREFYNKQNAYIEQLTNKA